MIQTFKSKGLAELWNKHRTAKIDAKMYDRIFRVLDLLHAARTKEEINVAGLGFHPLHGHKPVRYAVSVNGPWRITFEFENGDAFLVDFEQYH